jgi:hypothetical protein
MMSLSYLRDDYHKQAVTHIRESWWFELMYNLQGKTWPTWYICFPCQSTCAWRMLPVGGPRTWQPFTSHQQSWAGPLLLSKGAPNTIHNTLDDLSVGSHPVSLSSQLIKKWGQSQASIDVMLLSLLGPYHQHAIGTFNTCSWGPTHRSLIDTCGAYNLGGAGLPHTTPRPSQPAVSTFHLRASPDLHFNHE